jgi:hypothetical protein
MSIDAGARASRSRRVAAAGRQRSAISALSLAVVAAGALHASAGVAAQRTFVASAGDDTGSCTNPAPCRTFAAAILQTDPGGEIIALDSAGYGPVVIDRPVTIEAPPGIYAGIEIASGQAVGGTATGVVTLRGLALNSAGALTCGIWLHDLRQLGRRPASGRSVTTASLRMATMAASRG